MSRSAAHRLTLFVAGTVLMLQTLTCQSTLAIQQRNIEVLTPRSGAQGTTVEVLIQGLYLSQPKEILFYRPGIKAIDFRELPPLKRPMSLHHGGRVQHRIQCKFVIAPDCPLGEHPLRLRTATTLTTVATFWVGRFPIVPELERGGNKVRYEGGQLIVERSQSAVQQPNDTLATAQEVPLNVTVAGEIKVTSKLDLDYYKVRLRKGQRLAVEVDAVRLCDKSYAENEYDLQVRILNSRGQEIAVNDDSDLHVQDPILSVVAKQAGVYFIEIRQQLYKGGRWIFYRAHIGDFQRPLIAYPIGGQADKSTKLTLLGDAAGKLYQTVRFPRQTGNWSFYPGNETSQPPSPLPMRISFYPNVMESPGVTQVNRLPAALNGIISQARQTDIFRFHVKKGQGYRVKVFARGQGSPLDASLWIRKRGATKKLHTGDDSTWARRGKPVIPRGLQRRELLDPVLVFSSPESGEYELGIFDMRGLGGERYVYRVEIEPIRDVVHTYAVSRAHDNFEINRTAGFIIPRGNRWTINVSVARGLGCRYRDDLRLVARGLPAGVRMTAPLVKDGMNRVPVHFVADSNAQPTARLFSIQAVRADGAEVATTSQVYIPFINHSGGRSWHHVHLRKFALGITDEAPFTVELKQPGLPISQSGELKLQVHIQRRPGFDEAVDIQPDWLPDGISSGGTLRVPKGVSQIEYPISASRRARPGTFQIAMNATTTGGLAYSGVGRTRVSSQLVRLVVAVPYVALKFQPTAIRRNQTAQVVCTVKQQKAFQGVAKATLLGLPKGVTLVQPLPTLHSGDKRLVFTLKADRTALLGQYRQMRCQLTFNEGGQSIRQVTDNGVLRVDPEKQRTANER